MKITDNKEKSRFETMLDGYLAFLEYTVQPGIISLNHIEIDDSLRGKGIGSEFTEKILLQLEQRGLKVIPSCPFVSSYINKHSEWYSILEKNHNA